MLNTGKRSPEYYVLVTSLQLKNCPGLKGTDYRSRVISAYAASVKHMWKRLNTHYFNAHIMSCSMSELHSYPGYRQQGRLCNFQMMITFLYSIGL